MAGVEEVQVVVAHNERATLRVGGVFLKIDADQARTDVEVEAMRLAPVPTPEVLWRKPPVLAIAAVPGQALGRLGEPSPAPPPPWAGKKLVGLDVKLERECAWLVDSGVLPANLVDRNREIAEAAIRPW